MDNKKLCITILAGGLGKRMQSPLPKVLQLVDGKPMIVKILAEIEKINPYKLFIVVGQFKDVIDDTIKQYIDPAKINIEYAIQDIPKGTGHAVLCTLNLLDDFKINLIVNGDNPLLTTETMMSALTHFTNNGLQLQITAIEQDNPTGCGRIIITNDIFERIIEEKDCTDDQKKIKLVNCGIYIISTPVLKRYIPLIENNNVQQEYYLTDIVEICKKSDSVNIGLFVIDKSKQLEVININTKDELDKLNNILSKKIEK